MITFNGIRKALAQKESHLLAEKERTQHEWKAAHDELPNSYKQIERALEDAHHNYIKHDELYHLLDTIEKWAFKLQDITDSTKTDGSTITHRIGSLGIEITIQFSQLNPD